MSRGFSRQEYWSGLPFPSPGDLPDPGMETVSLVSRALPSGFFTAEPPGKPNLVLRDCNFLFRLGHRRPKVPSEVHLT